MTIEQRKAAYAVQNPLLCLESPMERQVYDILKTTGLCPILQFPLGKYFVDFAFPKYKVAIEYDGKFHQEQSKYDKQRDLDLKKLGWDTIRITSEFFEKFTVETEDGQEYKLWIEIIAEDLRKRFRELRGENANL